MSKYGRLVPQSNRFVNLNLPLVDKITDYEWRVEFLASSLANVLNVSKVFNDEFINVQYDASLFCSPLIEDVVDMARVYSYMSIFTHEVHQQLFNIVINWVPGSHMGSTRAFLQHAPVTTHTVEAMLLTILCQIS